jgi:hypothetical protein
VIPSNFTFDGYTIMLALPPCGVAACVVNVSVTFVMDTGHR